MKIDILDNGPKQYYPIMYFNEEKLLISRDLLFWEPVSSLGVWKFKENTLITYEY